MAFRALAALCFTAFGAGCTNAPAPGAGGAAAGAAGGMGGNATDERSRTISLLRANVPGSPHEARPHGVPAAYSWSSVSTRGPAQAPANTGFANFWGQIYVDDSGVRPEGQRVEVRGCSLWILESSELGWRRLEATDHLGGGAWLEDFSARASPSDFDMRVEGDGSPSFSTKPGENAHFWPDLPFVALPAAWLAELVVCSARLVDEDGAPVSSADPRHYLISVGADYRKSDGSCPDDICTSIGVGRFVYVTPSWSLVIQSTLDQNDIETLPLPPVEIFELVGN